MTKTGNSGLIKVNAQILALPDGSAVAPADQPFELPKIDCPGCMRTGQQSRIRYVERQVYQMDRIDLEHVTANKPYKTMCQILCENCPDIAPEPYALEGDQQRTIGLVHRLRVCTALWAEKSLGRGRTVEQVIMDHANGIDDHEAAMEKQRAADRWVSANTKKILIQPGPVLVKAGVAQSVGLFEIGKTTWPGRIEVVPDRPGGSSGSVRVVLDHFVLDQRMVRVLFQEEPPDDTKTSIFKVLSWLVGDLHLGAGGHVVQTVSCVHYDLGGGQPASGKNELEFFQIEFRGRSLETHDDKTIETEVTENGK